MNSKLFELLKISGKNNFEFTCKMIEGDNLLSLDLDNKKILLLVGDSENENLNIMIDDAIKTIKESL